jgi:hypothetical protein
VVVPVWDAGRTVMSHMGRPSGLRSAMISLIAVAAEGLSAYRRVSRHL